jgi:hypothetical protein
VSSPHAWGAIRNPYVWSRGFLWRERQESGKTWRSGRATRWVPRPNPGSITHRKDSVRAEFVTTPPLEGLGVTLDQVRGICAKDQEALDLIEVAIGSRQGERTDLVDNSNEVDRPTGNASATALRRLRKNRPDLRRDLRPGQKAMALADMIGSFAKQQKYGQPCGSHGRQEETSRRDGRGRLPTEDADRLLTLTMSHSGDGEAQVSLW